MEELSMIMDMVKQEMDAAIKHLDHAFQKIRAGRASTSMVPVSYTHLDVYKRQEIFFKLKGVTYTNRSIHCRKFSVYLSVFVSSRHFTVI